MANTNYPAADRTNEPRKSNNNKNILIGILAAGLLGTWGYFLYDKNQSNEKIQVAQTQTSITMTQRDSVQLMYNDALTRLDSITGNNNNLQGQLSEKQSEIARYKNEINSILRKKNASEAELTRARRLISELNGKIENLEAEVARLTGENQQLAATNTQLTEEKAVLETNLQTTTAEKTELAGTVDVGSTFSASNIQITPVNEKGSGKEKVTTSAKRVDKLVLSFDVENRIAKSGPADMYVIVTAPDGNVIADPSMGSGTLTTRSEGDKQFTAKVSTEYETGVKKTVQLPLRQNNFQTGNYKIEVFHNGFKIAEGTRSLKKGGIF